MQTKREKTLNCFGFNSGACRYAITPITELRAGMKRMFFEREMNEFCLQRGLTHEDLMRNQERHSLSVGIVKSVQHFLSVFDRSKIYDDLFNEWLSAPCAKRAYRNSLAVERAKEGREMIEDYTPHSRNTVYSGKPQESLADGKQLRATAEPGPYSSFELGPVFPLVKKAFASDFVYRQCRCTFVPGPKKEYLLEAFDRMVNPRYKLEIVFFSDDCCISIRGRTTVKYGDGDFEKADASIGRPVLESLHNKIKKARPELTRIINHSYWQCKKPIRFKNPHHRKSKLVIPIRQGQCVMPSGYSGTTAANNEAQIFFFTAFADLLSRIPNSRIDQLDPSILVQTAGVRAGFMVKFIPANKLQELSFLKCWPFIRDDGSMGVQPVQALPFRNQDIKSDLGLKLDEAVKSFYGEVVYSRRCWGNTSIQQAFEKVFPRTLVRKRTRNFDKELLEANKFDEQYDSPSDEQIALRYDLDSGSIRDLVDLLANHLSFGVHISHPVITRFMEKDYGYSSKTDWREESVAEFDYNRKGHRLRSFKSDETANWSSLGLHPNRYAADVF